MTALQSRDALCCVASRRVASRRGLSDPKIHSLPTSNFTTTALCVPTHTHTLSLPHYTCLPTHTQTLSLSHTHTHTLQGRQCSKNDQIGPTVSQRVKWHLMRGPLSDLLTKIPPLCVFTAVLSLSGGAQ